MWNTSTTITRSQAPKPGPLSPVSSLATRPYAATGNSLTSLYPSLFAIFKPQFHCHRWKNKTHGAWGTIQSSSYSTVLKHFLKSKSRCASCKKFICVICTIIGHDFYLPVTSNKGPEKNCFKIMLQTINTWSLCCTLLSNTGAPGWSHLGEHSLLKGICSARTGGPLSWMWKYWVIKHKHI